MVGGRRFFSNRDWMLLCIFALTFLEYNKLFYSLIYVHFVTSAKFFWRIWIYLYRYLRLISSWNYIKIKVFRFLCFVFYFAIA